MWWAWSCTLSMRKYAGSSEASSPPSETARQARSLRDDKAAQEALNQSADFGDSGLDFISPDRAAFGNAVWLLVSRRKSVDTKPNTPAGSCVCS